MLTAVFHIALLSNWNLTTHIHKVYRESYFNYSLNDLIETKLFNTGF